MRVRIRKTACVGVGLIGQSWAALFASKGYPVVIQDLDEKAVAAGLEGFNAILTILRKNGLIRTQEVTRARKLVQTTTNLSEAVEDADYVQESVFEDYELKRRVFQDMDRFAPEHAILASSSSGLLMSKIQNAVRRSGRCLIAHPFNPAHLIPLVELVPGRRTSRETIELTCLFMKKLGKEPIKVRREQPGYVANRLTAAIWREAIDLLLRGAASAEDIDRACRFGPGMRLAVQGPFLTYHLGGGPGGISYFLDHLTPSFESRWKSLAAWKRLPSGAQRRIIRSVSQMISVENTSFDQLTKDRDRQLVELIRVQKRIPKRTKF